MSLSSALRGMHNRVDYFAWLSTLSPECRVKMLVIYIALIVCAGFSFALPLVQLNIIPQFVSQCTCLRMSRSAGGVSFGLEILLQSIRFETQEPRTRVPSQSQSFFFFSPVDSPTAKTMTKLRIVLRWWHVISRGRRRVTDSRRGGNTRPLWAWNKHETRGISAPSCDGVLAARCRAALGTTLMKTLRRYTQSGFIRCRSTPPADHSNCVSTISCRFARRKSGRLIKFVNCKMHLARAAMPRRERQPPRSSL